MTEREAMTLAIRNLRDVLCDPEGNVCIHGSPQDRQLVWDALESLDSIESILSRAAEPVYQIHHYEDEYEFWYWQDVEKAEFDNAHQDERRILYTHPPEPADARKVCVWSEDFEGNWDTGCGNLFVLNEGTPSENGMKHCCYCGGKLEQVTDAAMNGGDDA
jgi:hypothetical protein